MKKIAITTLIVLLIPICYVFANPTKNLDFYKPCPICNSDKFLQIEFRNEIWTITCVNPSHFPHFLVMAACEEKENLVKVWNSRGMIKK